MNHGSTVSGFDAIWQSVKRKLYLTTVEIIVLTILYGGPTGLNKYSTSSVIIDWEIVGNCSYNSTVSPWFISWRRV